MLEIVLNGFFNVRRFNLYSINSFQTSTLLIFSFPSSSPTTNLSKERKCNWHVFWFWIYCWLGVALKKRSSWCRQGKSVACYSRKWNHWHGGGVRHLIHIHEPMIFFMLLVYSSPSRKDVCHSSDVFCKEIEAEYEARTYNTSAQATAKVPRVIDLGLKPR